MKRNLLLMMVLGAFMLSGLMAQDRAAWEFSEDADLWMSAPGYQVVTVERDADTMNLTLAGDAALPAILITPLAAEWDNWDLDYAWIRMKNLTDDDSITFWTAYTADMADYDAVFSVVSGNDTEFKDYFLNLNAMLLGSWGNKSSVVYFGFSPTEEPTSAGVVEVDFIRIVDSTLTVTSEGDATSVAVGATLQLTATSLPYDIVGGVTWSADNGNVTVDANGLVTGVSEGMVTVTATDTAANSGLSASLMLIVGASSVKETVANSLRLYPNPAGSDLHIECAASIASVTVVDLTGKVVLRAENMGRSELVLNTESLAASMYLLQATAENGDIITRRFVKR